MTLRFIGIDPNTDGDNCPTVWVDEITGDYILQGWRITEPETLAEIGKIPDRETVVRFPRRMARFFLESSDR